MHVPAQRAGNFFFCGTGLPTAVRKNPWFRGQTLLVPGHRGAEGTLCHSHTLPCPCSCWAAGDKACITAPTPAPKAVEGPSSHCYTAQPKKRALKQASQGMSGPFLGCPWASGLAWSVPVRGQNCALLHPGPGLL